ncbi:MAG: hypothetical protein ABI202_09050 [Candidatus Baltobacteraceae bacterium]
MAATAVDDPEAIFARAREVWSARTDPAFITCGVRVRYEHAGRIFDDWYQDSYRAADARLAVAALPQPEDAKRLGGVVFSIFGAKVFDTNPDAEPVVLAPPQVPPNDAFGIAPPPTPVPAPPIAPVPKPSASPLREIGFVVQRERAYRIELVGVETLRYGDAYHLKLTPLRDPEVNRLRELWIAKVGAATLRAVVAGLFNGPPYGSVSWTIDYVPIEGRYYVQQIRAMAPLHFSQATAVDARFDFVDYRFPDTIPDYVFTEAREFKSS